jgi:ribulose-5-phosphate 4-epimerase/fuculose-1-phosphate aldolase
MVSADSVLFADGIGEYPSAALVVTAQQGRRLAECLDDHKVVILKNHGIAVAASSVQDATFLAVSFDRSLRLQVAAQQFGAIDAISLDEVRVMNSYFDSSYHGRIEGTWQYLLRKAQRGERA